MAEDKRIQVGDNKFLWHCEKHNIAYTAACCECLEEAEETKKVRSVKTEEDIKWLRETFWRVDIVFFKDGGEIEIKFWFNQYSGAKNFLGTDWAELMARIREYYASR